MDKEREWVQGLLRAGLALAMTLMLLGLALKIASGDATAPSAGLRLLFKAGVSPGDRVMELGIVALAFTPAFRVLALLVLWIRERDWKFVMVSAIVLVLLGIAISLGGG